METYEQRQERERMEWINSEFVDCPKCKATVPFIMGNFGLCVECHEEKLNSPAYRR